LFFGILDEEIVVDALGPEFVLDHGNALAVEFSQDALQQRGFSSAEKAGEYGDGHHLLETRFSNLCGLAHACSLAVPATVAGKNPVCDYITADRLGQTPFTGPAKTPQFGLVTRQAKAGF